MTNLVIVESPAKASTIKSYLGSSYKVMASKGHVRDLPKSTLGIDIDNNFEPHYINIRGKGDLIKELCREASKADRVYLATDLDREGEAISWHLAAALKLPPEKVRRITFNEITKTAIKESIKAPRDINEELVNAQQARRILDRIVGYKISPFLWKNVRSGLSAGRVQSAATKIIVDREREIAAYVPKEYWTVDATLVTEKDKSLTAHYYGSAETGTKIELSDSTSAENIRSDCDGKSFTVRDVKRGTRYKSPAPPFTTSTMQQEASKKLNFQSQRTMKVAQELYEGVNLCSDRGGMQGLITYMRTDSLRIAAEAQSAARDYITETYGDKYCPKTPRVYKTKKNAEDGEKKEPEIAPFKCEICGSDMVYRTGRYGGFYACVRYPECKFTKQKVKSLGVKCPKCGKDIVTKYGRNKSVFYSCSGYPECDFSSWDMPTSETCPNCGGMLYVKKGKNQLVCKTEGCGYKADRPETPESEETK